MSSPKSFYAQQRRIYHPELLSCPSCGDLLVGCNDLKWDKIVQTLDRVLSVASRPGHCPNPECSGHALRLLSAQAQGIAPANSTYGYDVVTRIGWLRQHAFATFEQIHAELSQRVIISESHVRRLYQRSYLPLLACHERHGQDRLEVLAKQQSGLIIALDMDGVHRSYSSNTPPLPWVKFIRPWPTTGITKTNSMRRSSGVGKRCSTYGKVKS